MSSRFSALAFRCRAVGDKLALLSGLFALDAFAQQGYVEIERRLIAEQLHETGLDTLTRAQLEALNRLLRGDPANTATVGDVSRDAAVRDGARERSYIGLDDRPIGSRLKGSTTGWEPGTVFELENGQQWKVLKGRMRLSKALQAPDILVVPGVAGRWFLQVDPDLPKARVYRID